jgi:hypothetical protein
MDSIIISTNHSQTPWVSSIQVGKVSGHLASCAASQELFADDFAAALPTRGTLAHFQASHAFRE